jgi:hypothetical protein
MLAVKPLSAFEVATELMQAAERLRKDQNAGKVSTREFWELEFILLDEYKRLQIPKSPYKTC